MSSTILIRAVKLLLEAKKRKINPMIQISTDYSTSLLNVDTKYTSIGNGINTITNTNKTGIRDIMMNNPMYDFSGNVLNSENKSKVVVDAQIEEQLR